MHGRRAAPRQRILHWPIFSAPDQQRRAAIARAIARLIEEHRSPIRGYDTSANAVGDMFGDEDLALVGHDR